MGIGDYVLKQRKNERVDRKKEFQENRCGKETEKASIITGLGHKKKKKKKKKTTVKRWKKSNAKYSKIFCKYPNE